MPALSDKSGQQNPEKISPMTTLEVFSKQVVNIEAKKV